MSKISATIRKRIIIISFMLIAVLALYAKEKTVFGTAKGFGGELTVSVTLDEQKIIAVKIEKHNETPGVGTHAIEALPAIIIEKNSTKVDVISGASYTSRAIIEAVNNAIESSM